LATPLAFISPTEGFPWDDLRKILHGGQRLAMVQQGVETLPKIVTGYRRQTGGFAIGYSLSQVRLSVVT